MITPRTYLGLALSQPFRRFLQVKHPERVQGVPDCRLLFFLGLGDGAPIENTFITVALWEKFKHKILQKPSDLIDGDFSTAGDAIPNWESIAPDTVTWLINGLFPNKAGGDAMYKYPSLLYEAGW